MYSVVWLRGFCLRQGVCVMEDATVKAGLGREAGDAKPRKSPPQRSSCSSGNSYLSFKAQGKRHFLCEALPDHSKCSPALLACRHRTSEPVPVTCTLRLLHQTTASCTTPSDFSRWETTYICVCRLLPACFHCLSSPRAGRCESCWEPLCPVPSTACSWEALTTAC